MPEKHQRNCTGFLNIEVYKLGGRLSLLEKGTYSCFPVKITMQCAVLHHPTLLMGCCIGKAYKNPTCD